MIQRVICAHEEHHHLLATELGAQLLKWGRQAGEVDIRLLLFLVVLE
jgi:hypothetical protein